MIAGESLDSGGAVSPGMRAPVTPAYDLSDSDMEIPASAVKHKAESAPPGEHPKAQKMDDDPTPTPKVKAAKTDANVNMVAEGEMAHNDELGST